jgi:hypothetical protein
LSNKTSGRFGWKRSYLKWKENVIIDNVRFEPVPVHCRQLHDQSACPQIMSHILNWSRQGLIHNVTDWTFRLWKEKHLK